MRLTRLFLCSAGTSFAIPEVSTLGDGDLLTFLSSLTSVAVVGVVASDTATTHPSTTLLQFFQQKKHPNGRGLTVHAIAHNNSRASLSTICRQPRGTGGGGTVIDLVCAFRNPKDLKNQLLADEMMSLGPRAIRGVWFHPGSVAELTVKRAALDGLRIIGYDRCLLTEMRRLQIT